MSPTRTKSASATATEAPPKPAKGGNKKPPKKKTAKGTKGAASNGAPAKKPPKKTAKKKTPSKNKKGATAPEANLFHRSKKPRRKVIYKEYNAKLCLGKDALTYDQAGDLLGWEEVEGNNYLLIDNNGKKVICTNNSDNRPFTIANARRIQQEILKGNWKFNFEGRKIGRSGVIVDGQHSLVGFRLAVQEWRLNPDKYPAWKKEPTLDTLVCFGLHEDDETFQTMNSAKPQSVADSIYRRGVFEDVVPKEREKICKVIEYATSMIWDRTGIADAYGNLYKTNSEAMKFIEAHPRIVNCAMHIYQENNGSDKKVAKYVPVGAASGLMYLMATSKTDLKDYVEDRCEDSLDFSLWDEAGDFWTLLAAGADELMSLRAAMANLLSCDEGYTMAERIALVCKAWLRYVEGKPIEMSDLELKYHVEDDVRTLDESVCFGGIDSADGPVIEGEELAQRTQAERNKEGRQAPLKFKEGDKVLVDDPNTDNWLGELVEAYQGPKYLVAKVKELDSGDEYEVPYDTLLETGV